MNIKKKKNHYLESATSVTVPAIQQIGSLSIQRNKQTILSGMCSLLSSEEIETLDEDGALIDGD